jgi:hypothetical protein
MSETRKRWYDRDKTLAKQLDAFMQAHPKHQFETIKGLLVLIQESNPEILGKFTVPTDIERWHRRWYDKDPTYWIVLNGLRLADEELLKKVAAYLEGKLADV